MARPAHQFSWLVLLGPRCPQEGSFPARAGSVPMPAASSGRQGPRTPHTGREVSTGAAWTGPPTPAVQPSPAVRLSLAQCQFFLQQRGPCGYNTVPKLISYLNILRDTFTSLSSMKLQIIGIEDSINNTTGLLIPGATRWLHPFLTADLTL